MKVKKLQACQKHPLLHSLYKITLYNSQRDLPFSLSQMREAISFLLRQLKISTHEVIFHFVNERKISKIHKDFFNDPTSTDCITFPIDSPKTMKKSFRILGEAFICPKVALKYAEQHRIDPYEELLRYVIHCLLHLLGYDDQFPIERAKMKRKEKAYLKKLVENGFLRE